MKRIILFSLSLFLFSVLKPDYIHSQDKDGINKIIQQNLEDSTSDFIKSTGEDLQEYVQEEVSNKTIELTEQVYSPKFIDSVKSTFWYWWGQLLTFIQQKVSEFGKYYSR